MTKINKELFDGFMAELHPFFSAGFKLLIVSEDDTEVQIKEFTDLNGDQRLEKKLNDFYEMFGQYLRRQFDNIEENMKEIVKRWEIVSEKCENEMGSILFGESDLNEETIKKIEQRVLVDYEEQKNLALQSLDEDTVDLTQAPFAERLLKATRVNPILDPKTVIEIVYKNAVKEAPKAARASVMIHKLIEASLPAQNLAQRASTGTVKFFSSGVALGLKEANTFQNLGSRYEDLFKSAKESRKKYGEEVRNTFAYLEALINAGPKLGEKEIKVGSDDIAQSVITKIEAIKNNPSKVGDVAQKMIEEYRKKVNKVYGKDMIANSPFQDGVRTWAEVEAKLTVMQQVWPNTKMGLILLGKPLVAAFSISVALLSAVGGMSHVIVQSAVVATMSLIAAAITAATGAILAIGKLFTATGKLVGENHTALLSASKGFISAAYNHIKGLGNAYHEEMKGLMSENDNPNREEIKVLMSEETYDSVAHEQRSIGDVFGDGLRSVEESDETIMRLQGDAPEAEPGLRM